MPYESYALDPELAAHIDMIPVVDFADPAGARAQGERMRRRLPPPELPDTVVVENRLIPGPDGDVPIRIYTPRDHAEPAPPEPARAPVPGLVYVHGGGFVLGDLDGADAPLASICDHLGIVVVSVGYRLAPEHPYPAGLEDCYAALMWTAAHAAELGIDPDRLGMGGDSAGGGLTAGTTLLARDRGGPRLCFQYLGIPELDDRLGTPSMRAYVDTPLWHRHNAEHSWKHYLGDRHERGAADVPAYAAPARAQDLSGLPPAYITTCEFDPLRDEGLIYAQRLVQAGVHVESHLYAGTFHGSSTIAGAEVSKRMWRDLLAALQRGLRADAPRADQRMGTAAV